MNKTSLFTLCLTFLLLSCLLLPMIPYAKASIQETFTTSSYDGYIYNINAVYATARTAATGSQDDSSAYFLVGQDKTGPNYMLDRGFVYFNTAPLESAIHIIEATVSLYVVTDYSATDFDVCVQSGMPTYPSIPMGAGDYLYSHYGSTVGGSRNTNTITAQGYWNITLNATGIAWITTTGWTKFCLRSGNDVGAVAPSGDEYLSIRTNDVSLGAKLYISYVYAPLNSAFSITNMDAGNYVFAQEKYYVFEAVYEDYSAAENSYLFLDVMKINFTDGEYVVVCSYEQSSNTFTLESGDEIVSLGTCSATPTYVYPSGYVALTVDFSLYFNRYVLDCLNVDVNMWCNSTYGYHDGWETMEADYFNIYNQGGYSTLTSSGDAGRLAGGDVFDLYCYNGSSVEATLTFNNLQHIKLLPSLNLNRSTSGMVGPYWYARYKMEFYYNGSWCDGWELYVSDPEVETGASRWVEFHTYYYRANILISADISYFFYQDSPSDVEDANYNVKYWVDFWFNRVNSSSICGGRINAYYFPMHDTSSDWFRWLTGSNWGPKEDLNKDAMFFETMIDGDGNTVYASQIEMMRFSVKLEIINDGDGANYAEFSNHQVFDLTFGSRPFSGIQTPVFDETKVIVMPQGGFLGSLSSMLTSSWNTLQNWLGPPVMNFIDAYLLPAANTIITTLKNSMNTIFGLFGYPSFGDDITSFLSSLWTWFGTSIQYFVADLGTFFNFLGLFFTGVSNWVVSFFGTFTNMVSFTGSVLGGGYGMGVDFITMFAPAFEAVLVGIAIIYVVFLVDLADKRGFVAVLDHWRSMFDIVSFVFGVFLTIINLFISTIYRLIELLPFAE